MTLDEAKKVATFLSEYGGDMWEDQQEIDAQNAFNQAFPEFVWRVRRRDMRIRVPHECEGFTVEVAAPRVKQQTAAEVAMAITQTVLDNADAGEAGSMYVTKDENGSMEPADRPAQIVITEEMIEAGFDELLDWRSAGSCGDFPERACVVSVFRAMMAVALPSESEAFRHPESQV